MFLVKSRSVVMFSEICGFFVYDMTKFVFVLVVDVYIKCSESQMSRFFGGVLCTIVYRCIFLCIVLCKLIILSRSRGHSNPVVRHWERAHYRHMCHRSLRHVLKNGDRESQ